MRLKVKDMDIATGGTRIAILNEKDAMSLDLHHEDRIIVRKGKRRTVAVLDVAESEKAVPRGQIGLFEEVLDALDAKNGDRIEITLGQKPMSVSYIRKKMDGKELRRNEIYKIIEDIVENRLSAIELASYVAANYMRGMSTHETVNLTKAMAETGERINPGESVVADLHCIGGVPGNRTTMIVVPILVAAGLCVPKTASRAITSPSGTADTMEVLASVSLSKKRLEGALKKVGGFITWGGSINLAPSDDKIIRIEHPLSIDAEGQMLASIMAKKYSVGATHLLMDIPVGHGAKVPSRKAAIPLKGHFEKLAKVLGIKIDVMTTDGSQPIGNGIGPALEARDCLWVLQNDSRGPNDLIEKSVMMAGRLLEFTGKSAKGKGSAEAEKILKSGKAYEAMLNIIHAQDGTIVNAASIRIGSHKKIITAKRNGVVRAIDNIAIAKIARLAGAPLDKGAGIMMHVHKGRKVVRGTPLMTIYADNHEKVLYALEEANAKEAIRVWP